MSPELRKVPVGLLHLYGQEAHHDDAYLVGNSAALTGLWLALQHLLSGERKVQVELWASDGEGYTLHVVRLDADWQSPAWQRLAMPYTADFAQRYGDDTIEPHEIGGLAP